MRMLVIAADFGNDSEILATAPSRAHSEDRISLLGVDPERLGRRILTLLACAAIDTEPARDARSDLTVEVTLRAAEIDL